MTYDGGSRHVDGSPIFYVETDAAEEAKMRAELGRAFKCDVRPFAALTPIDAFAIRDGRMVGLIELRARDHAKGTFPTVYLSLRKWLALIVAGMAMDVPPIFAVEWHDGLGFVNVRDVDARRVRMGGNPHREEPVIEIPVELFRMVT